MESPPDSQPPERAEEIAHHPAVLEFLPEEFLLHLGIYLQTCAHIEIEACQLVCYIESLPPSSDAFTRRFNALRKKPLSDLIPILRNSGKKLPQPLDSSFEELVVWIDTFKLNRHIASHGAFFKSHTPGVLRVQYTHIIKNRTEYTQETSQIDKNLSRQLIADADRIFRTLHSLVNAMSSGEIVMRREGSVDPS